MVLAQFEISKAGSADLDKVLEILDDATTVLLNKESPPFGSLEGSPGKGFLNRSKVEKSTLHLSTRMLSGHSFSSGATCCFGEVGLWMLVMFTKLAIRPSYAGKGLGTKMLKSAETTTKNAGKTFLRLNCMANDRKIRDYYEKAGFVHVGDVAGPKAVASLYEKLL